MAGLGQSVWDDRAVCSARRIAAGLHQDANELGSARLSDCSSAGAGGDSISALLQTGALFPQWVWQHADFATAVYCRVPRVPGFAMAARQPGCGVAAALVSVGKQH